MNTFVTQLKREYWENRGGFFRLNLGGGKPPVFVRSTIRAALALPYLVGAPFDLSLPVVAHEAFPPEPVAGLADGGCWTGGMLEQGAERFDRKSSGQAMPLAGPDHRRCAG